MKRFVTWYRWTWQSNLRLSLGIVAVSVIVAWVVVLLFRRDVNRLNLEAVNLGLFALGLVLLASGLLNSERRAGAESMLLRLPRARSPALLARIAFLASAGAVHFVLLALTAGLLCREYGIRDHVHRQQDYVRDLLVFPRWMAADMVPVCLLLGTFGVLASTWTRKSALAVVIGLFLPIVLAFPLFALSAARSDFIDFERRGAANLVAWPLAALGLAAAVAAWFFGHRFVNRPRRAFSVGLAVLVVGGLLGAGYTAYAFARFDYVDPDADDFRLAAHMDRDYLNRYGVTGWRPVALGTGGRYIYVTGYRYIRGTWPYPPCENYSEDARHFLEDRGTTTTQWRIDTNTGEAVRLGEGRDRVSFTDLGSGLLRGVPQHGIIGGFAPKKYAVLGTPGEGDEVRLIDLENGTVDPLPGRRWGMWGTEWQRRIDLLSSSVSPVRDATGRKVWLRSKQGQEGKRSLEIAWVEGSRPVDANALPARRRYLQFSGWHPCPGGWCTWRGTRAMTIEADSGKLRVQDWSRSGWARNWGPEFLSPTKVLIPVSPIEGRAEWRYRLIDLDTGEEVEREQVEPDRIVRRALPDGRLLTLASGANERQVLRLWDPVEGTGETVRTPGELLGPTRRAQLYVPGSDGRGNMLILWRQLDREHSADSLRHCYVLYRHGSKSVAVLTSWWRLGRPPIEIIGIDEKDRVVALEADDDGTGCKRVVRLGPEEGQREVVFPRE